MIQRRKLLIGASALIAYTALTSTFHPALALEHDKNWAKARVPHELLVTLTCPIEDPGVQNLLASFKAKVAITYTILPNTYLIRTPDDAEPLALELENSGFASLVEPNSLATKNHSVTPNDPYYTGVSADGAWWLNLINAPTAWSSVQLQGVTAPIMVDINTGVQLNHPDLTGNVLSGYDVTTGSVGVIDTDGHGTYCAGQMAAITNNSSGIASTGWGGSLFPIRASTAGSYSTANLLLAVQYIVANIPGPGVLNMSWGGVSGSFVAALQQVWNNNYVMFAATGDAGTSPCAAGPIDSPYVVGVGSVTHLLAKDSYSQFGPPNSGVGPGCLISAPVGPGTAPFRFCSTTIASAYSCATVGTSFASPQATAVAAAIWSLRPDLKNWDIQSIMTNPANCNATTGFTPNAPCIDFGKLVSAAQSYVAPRYGATKAGRR